MHPCLSTAVWRPERRQQTAFASLGKRPKCFDSFRGRFPSLELLFGFVFLVSRQEKGKYSKIKTNNNARKITDWIINNPDEN